MNSEVAKPVRTVSYQLKLVGNETMDNHITKFNEWIQDYNKSANNEILPISTITIQNFFDHLLQDKNKYGRKNRGATLHGYKSAIKKAVNKTFKMSMEEKVAFELFFKKIKLPKVTKHIRSLTKDEIIRLINETEDDRTSLILKFLLITGLRISELINLCVKDIYLSPDNRDYNIYVVGKGNKEGIVTGIPRELIEDIKNVFQGREFLFEREKNPKRDNGLKNPLQYTRRQMYLLIEKAGIEILGKRINPHMTRHTCGRLLMDELKDVNKVQDRLRHSSVRTTIENYLTTKITNDDVKKAFKEFY